MTKREVEKLLKKEAQKIVCPDLKDKILANLPIKESNEPLIQEEHLTKRNFRHVFAPLFSCLMAVMLIIIVINFIPNGPSGPTSKNNRHKVYAMQAVSLANFGEFYDESVLLSSNNLSSGLIKLSQISKNIDEYERIANKINQYMLTASEMINSDNLIYEVVESDINLYQYKMNIRIDVLSHNEIYTLYFNEEPVDNKDIDDLDEVSTKISGIIKYHNNEFILEGKKEIENDEQEIELKMYLSADLSKYIIVNQEVEHRENEYSYLYYDNNKIVQQFELSVETKQNKKVVELEIAENNKVYEIEFTYKNDQIFVEYEFNNQEGTVEISSSDNEFIYEFSKDIKIIIKK